MFIHVSSLYNKTESACGECDFFDLCNLSYILATNLYPEDEKNRNIICKECIDNLIHKISKLRIASRGY
jgi:hypothetical protein